MVLYNLLSETINIDSNSVTTYGIEAKDERGTVISYVKDISPSKSAVEKLLEKCREYSISPCHLKDAVDDYIISDEYWNR